MKLELQQQRILELKNVINIKMVENDFQHIKELIRWLTYSKDFQVLKEKDIQLAMLDLFVAIWLKEKQGGNMFEFQGDILWNVRSLEDIEKKYLTAKFAVCRVENNVPDELCMELIEQLVKYNFSGYAMYRMIQKESGEVENNILRFAKLLKGKNELVKAIGILQSGVENYSQSVDLVLELADCWLITEQWERAYNCLCLLKNPGVEVKEMLLELEKIV